MIRDDVKLLISSGKGGNGGVKFGSGHPPAPMGGIGGKGGDVILEGTTNYYDLNHLSVETGYEAEDGFPGGVNDQRGRDGKDLIIKVPLITQVYTMEGELLCTISKNGEKFTLLKGGQGGLGNHYFRRGFEGHFDHANPGKPKETLRANIKLKLVADVVFIGFPNAGKSSLLNALTNAKAKVGNYPFTTLSPHLGRLPGITLMDLPGLIEGTATGRGLGTSFIKHTEFSRLVAHLISLESEDVLHDYNVMRTELKEISEDLYNKREVVVLSKVDSVDEETAAEKVAIFKNLGLEVVTCSSFMFETLGAVEQLFRDNLRAAE